MKILEPSNLLEGLGSMSKVMKCSSVATKDLLGSSEVQRLSETFWISHSTLMSSIKRCI